MIGIPTRSGEKKKPITTNTKAENLE